MPSEMARRLAKLAGEKGSLEQAYEAGRDAALNGADVENCGIRFFRTRELTDAWERGNHDGSREKIDPEPPAPGVS